MGLCSSKQPSEELNFSSLDALPAKPSSDPFSSALPPSSTRYALSSPQPSVTPLPPSPSPAKLDPADFIVSKRKGETIVREPGRIAGQSFVIEECEDCDIFLLDHSAAVTVDVCTRCRLYIGPCESSVFIRDSSRCAVVVAAQQLRLRGCTELSVLVYVGASQPSIEASSAIRLSSFAFPPYPQLSAQFRAAGLHPFNSQWSNVHDFHKKDADEDGQPHWSLLPYGTGPAELGFPSLSSATDGRLSAPDADADDVVPQTWGERPLASRESVLVLLTAGDTNEGRARGYDLIRDVRQRMREGDLHLLRTRCVRLPEDKAQRATGVSGLGKDALIGLEWDGEDAQRVLRDALARRGWGAQRALLVAEERNRDAIEAVFAAAAQV